VPTTASLAAALADRYRIERELGQGGMATVYLAEDIKHRRHVALKVLRPELAAVIGAARFLQEITTTANLQHPNILPLHDSGEVEGTVFYVMPFVEGESLRDRLDREKQLPIDDATRVASEIAGALDYAHRRGVIHRDIKPENILLHDGRAIVADFGIALAVSTATGGTRMTETGMSLGTPQYMSPEQAMGERTLDARSDVYALGCVLYEMLAGEPPFTGPTAQSIVAKVLTTDPDSVDELRKTVPSHVAAAVRTALQKLPADRFATAAEFSKALTNAGYSTSITSTLPGTTGARSTQPHRNRAWMYFAAGGISAAIVAAIAMPRESVSANEPRFYTITLPDSAPLSGGGDVYGIVYRSLDVSRDGRSLVYISESPRGVSHLMQLRLDNGVATPIPGTDSARSPVLSPDGKSVAFYAGRAIRRIALDGGIATTVLNDGQSSGSIHGWLDDGRIVYSAGRACAIGSVPAVGGAPSPVSSACGMRSMTFNRAAPEWAVGFSGTQLSGVPLGGEATFHPLGAGVDSSGQPTRIRGSSPLIVPQGFLVFVRDSTLYAARFDLNARRLTTEPRPVLSGVRHEDTELLAHTALADDGTFIYASGADASHAYFVRVDARGTIRDTLPVRPGIVVSYAVTHDGRRLAFTGQLTDGTQGHFVVDLERRLIDSVLRVPGVVLNWVDREQAVALSRFSDTSTALGRAPRLHADGQLRLADTTSGYISDSRDGSTRCAPREVRTWKQSKPAEVARLSDGGYWCRPSPDGRYAAWIGANSAIMVAHADERGAQLKVQVATGDEPRWSRDGKEIYFRDRDKFYVVNAPSDDMRPVPAPRLLFSGHFLQAVASWDRTDDGMFILLKGPAPLRTTRLSVITNFPRFLEEKFR
jgi:serine/threonine protein kinase